MERNETPADKLADEGELVVAYLRHFATRDNAFAWAYEQMDEFLRKDLRKAWNVTLALIAAAPDADALGFVAAGPLEDLLYARGEDLIDDVERLASSDEKFLSALRLVAGPFTKASNVSDRIVKAAGTSIPCVDDDWP